MRNDEKKNEIPIEVTKYFNLSKFMLILPIILCEDIMTMSAINYTVTNYTKDFSSYIIKDDKVLYIHKSYKRKLNNDGKDLFDPFCRETKFPYYYDDDKYVVTTVGQLNFYQWALEIGLLDYIRENFDDIILHMKRKAKKAKKSSSSTTSTTSTTSDILVDSIDSDMTTSEKNKYKNKVLVTERIRPKFKLNYEHFPNICLYNKDKYLFFM